MAEPSIAVVFASIGRPSLEWTLDSIAQQGLRDGDEVIVVRDAFEDPDDRMRISDRVEAYGPRFRCNAHDAGYHYYGIEQINVGFQQAGADYVFALSDDDVYCDGALGRLRSVCAAHLGRPVLFRFLSPWRAILWDLPRLRRSNISGQCIAVPRQYLRPMSTEHRLEVDYEWLAAIVADAQADGRPPVWCEDVAVITRPELRDGKPTTQGVLQCASCNRVIYREDSDAASRCCLCARFKRGAAA